MKSKTNFFYFFYSEKKKVLKTLTYVPLFAFLNGYKA